MVYGIQGGLNPEINAFDVIPKVMTKIAKAQNVLAMLTTTDPNTGRNMGPRPNHEELWIKVSHRQEAAQTLLEALAARSRAGSMDLDLSLSSGAAMVFEMGLHGRTFQPDVINEGYVRDGIVRLQQTVHILLEQESLTGVAAKVDRGVLCSAFASVDTALQLLRKHDVGHGFQGDLVGLRYQLEKLVAGTHPIEKQLALLESEGACTGSLLSDGRNAAEVARILTERTWPMPRMARDLHNELPPMVAYPGQSAEAVIDAWNRSCAELTRLRDSIHEAARAP